MSPDWLDAKAIFDEAIDLPEHARAAFVRERCAHDPALHVQVVRLLEWHAAVEPTNFLAVPPEPALEAEPTTHQDDPHLGVVLGPYVLVRVLGRGGMATVYEAERRDGLFDRTVAVKVLDRGPSNDDMARRVKQEREAQAGLAHRNITRLVDAGTLPSGEPYLVMELVDGIPIDRYCREAALDVCARLRLFLQVCDAVAAAHHLAILHRDIKPSNVLVTPEGHVKLLDFGLAKPLAEATVTTDATRWLTPAYASPEQLQGRPLTTGSDVYALGVVLFELLTDRLPYASPRDVPVALFRDILDERVLRLRSLSRTWPKDLDAVIGKALRHDPTTRYQNVDEFQDDVKRYLAGRPVTARPDSTVYRVRRFVQRHAVAATISAATLVGLLSAVTVALERGWVASLQAEENRRLLYAAEMRLAAQAFDAGNLASLHTLLDRQGPGTDRAGHRGIEWYLLRHAESSPVVQLPVPSVVNGVAWAPDERWIATAGSDGAITLWHGNDWHQQVIGLHDGKSWDVAFAPDARRVASVGSDGTLRCWRLAIDPVDLEPVTTATVDFQVKAHDVAARAVTFSPDGMTIVTGGDDGAVVLRHLRAPSEPRTLLAGVGPVRSIGYSPDGQWFAAASTGGAIYLWRADFSSRPRRLQAGNTEMNAVRFAADSRTVMAAAASGLVVEWDVTTGWPTESDQVDDGMMQAVAARPDGSTVLGAHGPWISQWRMPGWELTGRMAAHDGRVMALAVSPSGTRMVTTGADRSVKIWPLNRDVWRPWLMGHSLDVWRVAFSHDSRRLASVSNDGTLRLWNADSGVASRRIDSGVETVKSVAFLRDDSSVLAGLRDGRLVFWDPDTGRVQRERSIHTDQIRGLAVSPDGQFVAAASDDDSGSVWRLQDLTLAFRARHDKPVLSVAFSPDGRLLATSSEDHTVALWSVPDGRRVATLRGHADTVYAVVFSADSELIVTSSADTTIRIWQRVSLETTHVLTGHADRVWSVDLSGDSARVASASSDGTVKIWSTATGRELISLRGPTAWRHVRFSPDGQKLAAGSAGALVALWAAPRDP